MIQHVVKFYKYFVYLIRKYTCDFQKGEIRREGNIKILTDTNYYSQMR